MCGRSLWHIPIGDLRFTPCALEFFHDRTDQLGGSHLLDRHGPVGGVHGIDHKLPAHMSDAGKPDDGLGPTDVGDAEDRSPKFYTVVFATPGRQPPEVKAEDLAISETESSICSVLTLITGMDIEEVAGGRRERLGERASVIAAADAAAMPTPSTSEPRACGRLVRAAHVWLHRATLTMQADDSAHASAMADAALRCGDDGSDNAEALLVRARVARALAEPRTDMLAGERAVLAATRASVRACDLNDGEKDGACLAYDAVLASARASIGEAERASTIVMNDRKYDAEMQHAESVLEGAPGLVQGLPVARSSVPRYGRNAVTGCGREIPRCALRLQRSGDALPSSWRTRRRPRSPMPSPQKPQRSLPAGRGPRVTSAVGSRGQARRSRSLPRPSPPPGR